MAKVIDSKGLNEFIETGKHQTIEPHKTTQKEHPKAEEKKEEVKAEAKAEGKPDPDGNDMPEETLDQARAKISKKHRELMAEKALRQRLQDERDENERLAESQFNERRLVESERDRLKRELDELRLHAAPEQIKVELQPPNKDDPKFKNDKGEFQWDKFTEAQADYKVEKFKAEQQAEVARKERAALEVKVNERIEIAKAKYPDFMEKLQAQEDRRDVPSYIIQFMFESEQGADLAYYFANNREELTKISKLSPIMAISRLGKLETRFEKSDEKVETTPKAEIKADKQEAPARTSTAPPPITPLSGASSGTVITDPSKMSFQQLRAYEREKQRRG